MVTGQETRLGKAGSGPLKGIRVLELDDGLAQFCGKLLADLGAEVIKVEPPQGTAARTVPPFAEGAHDNASLHFWHYNTNKRSIVLDLDTDAGRAAFWRLAANVDIVLDGLAVGRLDKLGLTAESLRSAHDPLIFTRITPFGADGPWAGYASSDLVQLALGGTMAMTGYDDLDGHESFPIAPAGGATAHFVGMMAAIATLAALNARDHTGRGQIVDLAAHDVVAVSNEMAFPYWEYLREDVYRHTARHGNVKQDTPRQMFRCRDGKYAMCLTLYLRETPRFRSLVGWMETKGLAEDLGGEDYASTPYRDQHSGHILDVIERFCAQIDSAELFAEAQRLGIPWAPINGIWEVLNDPHLREDRGAIVDVDQPELGRSVLYPGAPYQFTATPWSIRSTAPTLGADNALLEPALETPLETAEARS